MRNTSWLIMPSVLYNGDIVLVSSLPWRVIVYLNNPKIVVNILISLLTEFIDSSKNICHTNVNWTEHEDTYISFSSSSSCVGRFVPWAFLPQTFHSQVGRFVSRSLDVSYLKPGSTQGLAFSLPGLFVWPLSISNCFIFQATKSIGTAF